jgi:Erv1 / Alr family
MLPKMIPCDKCRAHSAEYLAAVPFDLKPVPDDELHDWVRHYFWEFHEHVNSGTGKPSFPEDQLTTTYRSVNISTTLRQLGPFIETAIRLSGITLFPWQKFQQYTRMLISLYGL